MKKTLLASTALVAGTVLLNAAPVSAAEKIKLHLGGFMEQWFGYSNEDDTYTKANGRANGFDEKSDSEIHFKGNTTLDNGVKVGVKWEMEGDGNERASSPSHTSRFDEALLYLSGSFGRINMGQEDTASETMGYGAPSVGPVGLNKSDARKWIRQPTNYSGLVTHSMDLGLSDKHNISYYTPRIAGVQFGASYHPVVNENADDLQSENSVAHNGMSAAVNYVSKINKANVAAYFGFATKENADNNAAHANDPTGWGSGLNVGFGGFTLGGSYINENTSETATNWNVGLRYKMGMNAFSIGYQESETTNSVAHIDSKDKGKLFQAGYERTLGPGVRWSSGVAHVKWDSGEGTGANNENDGFMVVTGVRLDF